MIICSQCSTANPPGASFCFRCGLRAENVQQRSPQKTKSERWKWKLFALLVVLLIAIKVKDSRNPPNSESVQSKISASSALSSPSPSSTLNPEELRRINAKADKINKRQEDGTDIKQYLTFIRSIDKDGDIVQDVRLGSSPGYVRITVTNQWHYNPYQIRLQTAQKMWQAWAGLHSPAEPDKARIKIVDMNGNEIGGSRILGGSLIWVND